MRSPSTACWTPAGRSARPARSSTGCSTGDDHAAAAPQSAARHAPDPVAARAAPVGGDRDRGVAEARRPHWVRPGREQGPGAGVPGRRGHLGRVRLPGHRRGAAVQLDHAGGAGRALLRPRRLPGLLRGAAARRPYLLPRGGATPLGAVGYVSACLELAEQLAADQLEPAQLWLATESCGTQAGLVAGARWLRFPFEVVGVAVSRPVDESLRRVEELAEGAAKLLGTRPPAPAESPSGDPAPASGGPAPTVLGGYLGPGYGIPSADGDLAATLVARTEGVFLDPGGAPTVLWRRAAL